MARLGITFEQVEIAAETILAAGKNPTIERVRRLLGDTGSNSTLSKHLNDWRSTRLMATRDDLPAPHLPPDPVHAAVNRVWQQIYQEAEANTQSVQAKAAAEIEAIQQQYQALKETHAQLIKERSSLQEHAHQLTAEKEILSLDFKTEQQQRVLLEERCHALQQQYQISKQESTAQLAEIKSTHQQEIQRITEQMQLLKKNCDQYISDIKSQNENLRQHYLVEMDALKMEKQKQEKKILQLTAQNQMLEGQLAESQLKLKNLTKEKDWALQHYTEQEKNWQSTFLLLKELKEQPSYRKDEMEQTQKYWVACDERIKIIEQIVKSIATQLVQRKIQNTAIKNRHKQEPI
jgi:chromosome segregation ATPase